MVDRHGARRAPKREVHNHTLGSNQRAVNRNAAILAAQWVSPWTDKPSDTRSRWRMCCLPCRARGRRPRSDWRRIPYHPGLRPWAAAESKNRRPGGDAMLERMSEMMFIDAVRRYVDTLPADSRGWLAGLRDHFVGRARILMHGAPATAWTVDELGRRIGLSRSALHERFADVIGQAPMQYLANWRMQVGAALLRDTTATVASIAQEVGYESEAAFARAFKRLVGTPPALWRRQTKRVKESVRIPEMPAQPAS